jgi:hypothetical protein
MTRYDMISPQERAEKNSSELCTSAVAHTCHGFLIEAYIMNRSTYEVNDHVSTPLTPILRLIAPDIQNIGPPATEDSRRHTPSTFPEFPPTCGGCIMEKIRTVQEKEKKEIT